MSLESIDMRLACHWMAQLEEELESLEALLESTDERQLDHRTYKKASQILAKTKVSRRLISPQPGIPLRPGSPERGGVDPRYNPNVDRA